MIYIPASVRMSVHPSIRTFPIDYLSINYLFNDFFSNLVYKVLSGMSGMGLLMGKIGPF